jgi:CubicO group peptidase (beta-lactamase class C family)
MDETILRYAQLVAAPGERYQYSNLGYGILGYVIARASGETYADFMRKEVFLKLGLTHTSVNIGPGLENQHAVRYGADGTPIPFYDFDHPAASAVFSSAHDLVRFGLFHLKAHLPDQAPILSDAAIGAMQVSTMASGPGAGYGVGWAVQGKTVSHTGGMGGVATTLRLVPSEGVAVVVLANAATPLPHRIAALILEKMIPGWKAAPADPAAVKRAFQPPPELAGEWRGALHTYEREIPLTLRILGSGDVHARLGDQLETLLNNPAWSEGELRGAMAGDIGTADANRRPYTLQLTLKLRGAALSGSASAISLPGRRAGNALTQWVELRKPSAAP